MAPKVHTEKHRHCAGEAPSEEVAPWNTSAVGNLPLPADNRTVYPQGSVSLVNKIHAPDVEDVEDRLYRI